MRLDEFIQVHFPTDKNKNRFYALKKLLKHIGHKSDDITYAFDEMNTQQLIEACRQIWSNEATFVTNLGALKKALERLTSREFDVSAVMKEGSKQVQQQRGANLPTKKMLANPEVTWEALQEIEKTMRETEYGSPQHALLALRVLAWPRRDSDLKGLIVSRSRTDVNTIHPETLDISYRVHKTAKKTGEFILKMDNEIIYGELAGILRKFVENKEEEILWPDVPGLWKSIMLRYFGADFGIREIRRLAAEFINRQRYTANQKQMIAECMGHSITQSAYYDVQREETEDVDEKIEMKDAESQTDFDDPLDDAMEVIRYAHELMEIGRADIARHILKQILGDQ